MNELEEDVKIINQDEDYTEEKYNEIRNKYKERKKRLELTHSTSKILKLGCLNYYSMFIASRWFETIEDYINLELSTPKWKGNLLRFYYNPISLNNEFERELFPKLETLYLYEYNDNEYKEDKRIKKRVIWYGVNKEEIKENKDTTKIYKNILTTTPNEINVNEKELQIINDTGLISIGNQCFNKNLTMKNIKIPSTIRSTPGDFSDGGRKK